MTVLITQFFFASYYSIHLGSKCSPQHHIKCSPCHHVMTRPQVADGGDGLRVWKIAENTLNNQSRAADNAVSSQLLGWVWG
jgi:hypothetical protein